MLVLSSLLKLVGMPPIPLFITMCSIFLKIKVTQRWSTTGTGEGIHIIPYITTIYFILKGAIMVMIWAPVRAMFFIITCFLVIRPLAGRIPRSHYLQILYLSWLGKAPMVIP